MPMGRLATRVACNNSWAAGVLSSKRKHSGERKVVWKGAACWQLAAAVAWFWVVTWFHGRPLGDQGTSTDCGKSPGFQLDGVCTLYIRSEPQDCGPIALHIASPPHTQLSVCAPK